MVGLHHVSHDRFWLTRSTAIAQTSLAEILLRLNTGLVTIISSFLNRDKKDVQLDYHSLTVLSEQSRIDTCRTLRQLFRRMCQLQRPYAPPVTVALQNREEASARTEPDGDKHRKRKPSTKATKIQGPTLARVVIQGSSKPSQIAMVKPGERRKKSSSSAATSKADSEAPTAVSTPLSSPPAYDFDDKPEMPPRPAAHRSHTVPQTQMPSRKQSLANVRPPAVPAKPDALRATISTSRLRNGRDPVADCLPPMPDTAPLPAIEPRRRRQPTPTFYSIASDSTKLGEIPLHKWAQPFDFDAMSLMNKEAAINGWHEHQLDDGEGKKKRFGIFRLFRRKEVTA